MTIRPPTHHPVKRLAGDLRKLTTFRIFTCGLRTERMIPNVPTLCSSSRDFRLLVSLLLAVVLAALSSQTLRAQSPADCPGVIINEVPAPSRNVFGNLINPKYVSDPCILVLSNGDYLAAHALFGSGSGAAISGRTSIFRSSNQGLTWTKVNGGNDLTGILRGSLFEQGGAVYLLGGNKDTAGNFPVISKSTDNGSTWSAPTSLAPLGALATPDNALIATAASGWPARRPQFPAPPPPILCWLLRGRALVDFRLRERAASGLAAADLRPALSSDGEGGDPKGYIDKHFWTFIPDQASSELCSTIYTRSVFYERVLGQVSQSQTSRVGSDPARSG